MAERFVTAHRGSTCCQTQVIFQLELKSTARTSVSLPATSAPILAPAMFSTLITRKPVNSSEGARYHARAYTRANRALDLEWLSQGPIGKALREWLSHRRQARLINLNSFVTDGVIDLNAPRTFRPFPYRGSRCRWQTTWRSRVVVLDNELLQLNSKGQVL